MSADEALARSLEAFERELAAAAPGGAEGAQGRVAEPGALGVDVSAVPVFEEGEVGSGDAGAVPREDAEIAARAEEGYEPPPEAAGGGAVAAAAPTYPPPPDVGDGRGDDLVLRQIREAALHEPDPELRERLWEEYRRLKGSR
ncbi:MAG: hypothetical protein KatS3mg124_0580 [Porticoccaceae bacterium]|nr:MAG: hypothetical protein KatS3mg124_0580 [Porticoccaceae bacterium]